MIRYSILLLVINTYGRGLGNPVDTLNGHLESLANTCASPLLAKGIKEQQANCKVFIGEPIEKRVQCLLFYDINKQLCAAVTSTKLTVTDDSYKAQMSQTLDVTTLCNTAKTWELKNYSEIPEYHPEILKNQAACLRVCSGQDLLSVDANFYCKYFNWGYELLKTPPIATSVVDLSGSTTIHVVNNSTKVETPAKPTDAQQVNKGDEAQDAPIPAADNPPPSADSVKTVSEPGTREEAKLTEVTAKPPIVSSIKDKTKEDKVEVVAPKIEAVEKPAVVAETVEDNKLVPVEEEPPKKEDESKKPSGVADAGAPVVEDTKPKAAAPANEESLDDADDVDSEEGKESLLDLNGDDGDDPDVGDFAQKPYEGKLTHKKTITAISSANSDAAEREMFQSMDAYADGDDNFFPFFLTCIIVVVVLYVLYHNKNKVTKVVLGLIVEGRQPGRRRNSRGHAYRRLDTLEQAMSSNTATAPSRIIY
ncbi:hypothetical protein JYU34_004218 [Plutella xylostella]|uniref:Uncharacterized protein n=1 Tax=Plutella xylostella TaxID=51655 RepID=A0ABQ7QXH9_PLUXY|nr:hypothetical protein JYU34_004218 [Plutella xylostella]